MNEPGTPLKKRSYADYIKWMDYIKNIHAYKIEAQEIESKNNRNE